MRQIYPFCKQELKRAFKCKQSAPTVWSAIVAWWPKTDLRDVGHLEARSTERYHLTNS